MKFFSKKPLQTKLFFKAFVKDIVGIEVEPDTIETEKAFQPQVGNINFNSVHCGYDIFAEDIIMFNVQRTLSVVADPANR